MTTAPVHPALRVPKTINDHTKRLIRAESRLDQAGSTDSKQTADIAANAAAVAAVNTRLGGTGQETYLGTLGQMSHMIHINAADVFASYDQTNLTNQLTFIINKVNSLLDELQASNYQG